MTAQSAGKNHKTGRRQEGILAAYRFSDVSLQFVRSCGVHNHIEFPSRFTIADIQRTPNRQSLQIVKTSTPASTALLNSPDCFPRRGSPTPLATSTSLRYP